MSVVLVSPGGVEPIRRTLHHLRNQTARDLVELVVVAPSPFDGGADCLDGFAGAQLVAVGPIRSTATALAAGVRAASAPVVCCAEEHSFPDPGWAETLIGAHEGSWAAVGGVLRNANPATRISWASLFSDFGPAVAPVGGGRVTELPGHHTAYKREALVRYGPALERMLEVEWVLQEDMRAAGEDLFREPRAVSWHLNPSRLRSYLRSEFHGGRSFAGNRPRNRGWGALRRALYAAGSPLLPFVRIARSLPDVRRSYPAGRASFVPLLALGLLVNAAGQMLGYALGPGRATGRRLSIELSRHRHLTIREQAELAASPLDDLPPHLSPR